MVELTPCVEIAACLGGYVVKTVTCEDGGEECVTNHRVVGSIAQALDIIRAAIESMDALPSKDHKRIEEAMNG